MSHKMSPKGEKQEANTWTENRKKPQNKHNIMRTINKRTIDDTSYWWSNLRVEASQMLLCSLCYHPLWFQCWFRICLRFVRVSPLLPIKVTSKFIREPRGSDFMCWFTALRKTILQCFLLNSSCIFQEHLQFQLAGVLELDKQAPDDYLRQC